MKKIYRYVFKLFVSPLLATFVVSLFVLLMQFLWRYMDDIVGKGLDFHTLMEFFSYSMLTLVPLALPLAILLASLMTFGNLGERLELLSIKAAGVSLSKIMRPLIIFVAFISIGAFFFANNVLPYSMNELRSLMNEIQHQRPELSLKENVFDYSMDDMAIKVGKKAPDGSMLYDIMLYNHNDRTEMGSVTVADSGTIVFSPDRSYSTITLYSGSTYDIVKKEGKRYDKIKAPYRRDHFSKQVAIIKSAEEYERPDADIYGNNRTGQNLKKLAVSIHVSDSIYSKQRDALNGRLVKSTKLNNHIYTKIDSNYIAQKINIDSLFLSCNYSNQTLIISKAKDEVAKINNQLESQKKGLKWRKLALNQFKAERHRRFTLSIACLVFFFIGAPLGAIIRKGGFGMPVVISILFFVIYYIMDTFGYKFATEDFTSIWFGMWMSSALLLLIGVFLTWKAANDSAILEADVYRRFLKRINIFKKNNNKDVE